MRRTWRAINSIRGRRRPRIAYNGQTTSCALGGAEVRVLHLGRSHTGGDSVVYYPDLKVVSTSDAVTVGAGGPLVDYAGGGSALELACACSTRC